MVHHLVLLQVCASATVGAAPKALPAAGAPVVGVDVAAVPAVVGDDVAAVVAVVVAAAAAVALPWHLLRHPPVPVVAAPAADGDAPVAALETRLPSAAPDEIAGAQ